MSFLLKKNITLLALVGAVSFGAQAAQAQQAASPYRSNESVRSDKFTGGRIERAALVAGEPDIEITVDVPAFCLTLWQKGKEVKTYAVGVGRKDFPISIGEKQASEIIWNPDWIPPNSEWVTGRKGVKAGEVIRASDPRNPLGKLKIPLGYGYLIHQAAAPTDLGNLVSHGCIRMLRTDLYDLAEKIVAARGLPVSAKKIANAKVTKNTVVAKLDEPLAVDINYDTEVVEGGYLHLYPDVYERGTNTVKALRAELESSGVDASALDDATLKAMLARVNAKQKYVVSVESITAGRALADGRVLPLVGSPAAKKKVAAKKRTA
ncbi:MAG: L,D-transpeptidase ErfK/SrfK [Pyrinomonadaceae bacterium]|nr:L,D-transpeptidase ErfK/SrfK [Pyrinomonadaceae bacterium]